MDLRASATQTGPDNKGLVSETFRLLQEIGCNGDGAKKIISAVTQGRKRGRPARKRELYLEAFTLMLTSKEMSLTNAIEAMYDMNRLCDCEKTHTESCLQRFKSTTRKTRQDFQTGIRDIKDRLRESEAGRELVEQYDALHPDRRHSQSKKSMER